MANFAWSLFLCGSVLRQYSSVNSEVYLSLLRSTVGYVLIRLLQSEQVTCQQMKIT